MGKMYSVMMGDEIMFGPVTEDKYEEVKSFVNKLAPVIRAKCVVKATSDQTVQSEGVVLSGPVGQLKVEKVGQVSANLGAPAKSAPVNTKPKVADTSNDTFNSVFNSFLEGESNTSYWKPKDGRNIVRILPVGGVLPSDWVTPYPFLKVGFHSKVGLSMNDTVCCPRLTYNKACPICQFQWTLYKSNNNEDKELAKEIRAYDRIIANIIDLSDVEKGVQKYAFGKTLARKIMTYIEDPEFKPLLDPEKGHNFIIIKKTVDNFPNYDDSRPEVKISSLTEIYPRWREEAIDLKGTIDDKSWDEMTKVLDDTKKSILSSSPNDLRSGKPAPAPKQPSHVASAVNSSIDDVPIVEESGIDGVRDALDRL